VGGQLLRVHFREGDDVREGQVLFTIDPQQFEVALRAAEANLARDRARAASARAEIERYGDLITKDYVTKQDFDNVKANAEAAAATVQADSAAVAAARLDLQYATITAPISGRTGDLLVREGNLVKANDDKALVVINQLAPIAVSFAVPQQRLAEIRRYASGGALVVRATIGADTTQASTAGGHLSFIDNSVDPSTGTIMLKAFFPNADKTLWPGQFATVAVDLTVLRGAVVVPAGALQTGQAGDYVFVVGQDQSVAMRPVRVGPRLDDRAAIDSGLQAGEQVVTDGQLRLFPGAKVTIKNGAGAAEASRR
jgi:multidrug efflux system membrane fusion protein